MRTFHYTAQLGTAVQLEHTLARPPPPSNTANSIHLEVSQELRPGIAALDFLPGVVDLLRSSALGLKQRAPPASQPITVAPNGMHAPPHEHKQTPLVNKPNKARKSSSNLAKPKFPTQQHHNYTLHLTHDTIRSMQQAALASLKGTSTCHANHG